MFMNWFSLVMILVEREAGGEGGAEPMPKDVLDCWGGELPDAVEDPVGLVTSIGWP